MTKEWIVQQHKRGNGQQEIQVSIIVKEMQTNWAYDSSSWISAFEEKLKCIKKTNCFSAEFGYKATPRNNKSVEVWKMKANGDFNYKMFTVTRQQ